jgi:hypothetical protein
VADNQVISKPGGKKMTYGSHPALHRRHALGALIGSSAILLALVSAAPPPSVADAGQPPRIVDVQYYQDLEDGKHYNVLADVSRKPDEVTARSGGLKAEGRLSGHIGPAGGPRQGKSWFFRQKRFVKAVRADLADDGVATLKVRARNEAGTMRKLCTLTLEPDPIFGDFADGDCKRL